MTKKEQLARALNHVCGDEYCTLQYSMPIKVDEKTIVGTEGHVIMYYQDSAKNLKDIKGVRNGSKLTVVEIEERYLNSDGVKEYTVRLERIIKYSKKILNDEGAKYYEGAKVEDIYEAVMKDDYVKIDEMYFNSDIIYRAIEALMMLGVKAVNIEKSGHDMIALKARNCGVYMVGVNGKPRGSHKVKTSIVREGDTEICYELGAEYVKKYDAEKERKRLEYERSKKIFTVQVVAYSWVVVEAVTEEEAKELAKENVDIDDDFDDCDIEVEDVEDNGLKDDIDKREIISMGRRVITANGNVPIREYFGDTKKKKSRT